MFHAMMPLHPLLLATCLSPIAWSAPQDASQEQYRFITGLFADGHWELCVKESSDFLQRYASDDRVVDVRYRLAAALFELKRLPEAGPHFRTIADETEFTYYGEVQLRLGQCELQAGRLTEARAALQRARSSGKDYLVPHATFLLAETDFRSDRFQSALETYKNALSLDPEAESVSHARRGVTWCEFRLGRFEESVAAGNKFLNKHAEHPLASEVRFVVAESLAGQSDWKKAIQAYSQVGEGAYANAALRGRALAKAAGQDHLGAASDFMALMESDLAGPFAEEARIHAGAHLLQAGKNAEAWTVLAEPASSKDPELLFWRGKATSEHLGAEEALPILHRALEQKPGVELLARIQSLRGELLYGLGRLDEATQAFESAESDFALNAAATAHLAAGRAKEALQTSQKLLERYPTSEYRATSQRIQAEALFTLERFEECQPYFISLYQDDSVTPEDRGYGLHRYGWCRYLAGDTTEAFNTFQRVMAQFPGSEQEAEAIYMTGRCAFESDSMEAAQSHWELYLERFPEGANRNEILLGLGRAAQDKDALKKLLSESPASPLASAGALQLAQILEAEQDWPKAITRYRLLLRDYSESTQVAEAHYGLAWCLNQSGEPGAAIEPLKNLLQVQDAETWRVPALELLLWCATDSDDLETAQGAWGALSREELESGRRFAAVSKLVTGLKTADQNEVALSLLSPFHSDRNEPEIRRSANLEAAWIRLDLGQLEPAEKHLQDAIQQGVFGPRAAEAAFFLGEAHYKASAYNKAFGWYQIAIGAPGTQVADQALYKAGFSKLQAEQPAQAAPLFAKLTTDFPDSPLLGETLYLLGEAHWRADQPQSAIAPLQRVRKDFPKHAVLPKALFRLGQALRATGEASQAQSVLSQLVKGHGDFEAWAEAELERGLCLVAMDRKREALAAFERVVQKDKGILGARARIQIGLWHEQKGDTETALAEYLKVVFLFEHPDEVAEAMYRAGTCLEKTDDQKAAIRQYDSASKKHPKTTFGKKSKQRLQELQR